MPMIACQECGNQISSLAKVCIHCGAPTIQETTVKIKLIPYLSTYLSKALHVNIFDINGRSLWSGVSGSVAVFKIDKPIKIRILTVKGLHSPTEGYVYPGKRYQVKHDMSKFAILKTNTILVEVDVIDSD